MVMVLAGVGLVSGGETVVDGAKPAIVDTRQETGQAVRHTNLVCRSLVCYDGAFLEDGTDEEVTGVTALVLENTGGVDILRAVLEVVQGDRLLNFETTCIPAHSTVLVLESGGQAYTGSTIDSCRCLTLIPGTLSDGEGAVTVTEAEQGLYVTNPGTAELTLVRLRYKQYHSESGMYLGGITYETELYCLQPGESRYITPYHYAAGYSAVVSVTYHTDGG